ncbi:hypothetical protein EfmAA290_17180 [Enterococcus faecium]|nr:hypothetical protein EfmAA290_17180 [Enterococcus faecium]
MKADLGLDWLKPIANGKESGMLSIKKQKSLKINNIVAKEGFKGFTARNIAKKMGISTQPIYLEFKNMEDLKNTLLDSIFEQLKEDVFPIERVKKLPYSITVDASF